MEPLYLTVFEIFASGYDLDHSGSRDITGHMTICYPRCHFLYVLYCNRVCVTVSPALFEIAAGPKHIGVTTLAFHRDDIGHLTIPFVICHFLLVPHWNRVSAFNRFRDIRHFGPKPLHTHTCALWRTHREKERKTPQVILYSVPCNELHWTDNKIRTKGLIIIQLYDVENVKDGTKKRAKSRVAIWLYARPNKSNLALFDRSWPWNFWFGILALFWPYWASLALNTKVWP